MNVSRWLTEVVDSTRNDGMRGFVDSLYPVYHKFHQQIPTTEGQNIFDAEWDVLVVLDATRADLFAEVVTTRPQFAGGERVRSVNSQTSAWMRDTFTEAYTSEMAETTYVCGNPFSDDCLDAEAFDSLIEVWREAWTEPGTVPPRAVTDHAVRHTRRHDPERMIVHYMQPHCPFLDADMTVGSKQLGRFGNQDSDDVWTKLRKGILDHETVWEGYRRFDVVAS